MNIRPLQDRLVVRREEKERTSPGGVLIPESAGGEKPTRGTVISVGKGRIMEDGSRRAPELSQGDVVVFGRYAGTDIEMGGEKLLILKEEDVMGVITD